ncbi:MAG: hypothetical protein ACLT1W_15905 [Alistipes onderdonkii]
MKKIVVLALVVWAAASCVSNKKFNSMKAEALRLEGELTASKGRLDDLGELNDRLTAEKMKLASDTTRLGEELGKKRYQQLLADSSASRRACCASSKTQKWRSTTVRAAWPSSKACSKPRRGHRRHPPQGDRCIDRIRRQGLSISSATATYTCRWTTSCCSVRAVRNRPQRRPRRARLAGVLALNPDINFMVEGHTDDALPFQRPAQG